MFAADLAWADLPADVRDRTQLVLTDVLGVTVAGARTAELRALTQVWDPPKGPCRLVGTNRGCGPDDAAWINGTATCVLELDEGHKQAQGHPAAHVVPAVLAAAQASRDPVPGHVVLEAVLVGYEVAARFGRATRRRADLHTHGHWGAAGAGAAVAKVRGLLPERIAAAVDASTGLMHVTPWKVVLAGSFVRNLWAAGANVAGLIGARLSAAQLADAEGTADHTLGDIVGGLDAAELAAGLDHRFGLDAAELAAGLGHRWDVTGGYFKRHASCSYTHPAADAVLDLMAQGIRADDVAGIVVETHRLAAPLSGLDVHTRLAAMFSLPYVVAVAVRRGKVDPAAFSSEARGDERLLDLARRIEVRHAPDLDDRLPNERANRVTVSLADGRSLEAEVPNPVGDADFHPMGPADVRRKLVALVGEMDAQAMVDVVGDLAGAADARDVLARLP